MSYDIGGYKVKEVLTKKDYIVLVKEVLELKSRARSICIHCDEILETICEEDQG